MSSSLLLWQQPQPSSLTSTDKTVLGEGAGKRDSEFADSDSEPAAIPGERQALLEALKQCASPSSFWTSLPVGYQTDKEFVLACLKRSAALPHKSDFERKFPQPLRFDRDVILAFCARDDFAELYETRHLYPPECLTSDKEVMLAYCSKIPRSLQECAEELTDDRDVVEAAIALDGLELQYASPRLQEDAQVVRTACQSDGRALEFCPPGPLRDSLCRDKDFMMQVLRRQGGPMLRLVSEPLRDDRELLLEALAHGMRFRFCPLAFQADRPFLLEALQRKAELYLEFNRQAQSDFVLALAAVVSPTSTPTVLEKAVALVPSLQNNRQVALAIAKHGSRDYITNYFMEGNHQFRDDKEVVLAVLAKKVTYYSRVSDRLKVDKDVLIAAMNGSTALDVLKAVSPQVQERHPEVTVHAIRVASSASLRYFRSYVPDPLWRTKPVAIAWIQRGNRCLNHFAGLYGDPEFALEVAAANFWSDFHLVSPSLRASLPFMQRAVDRNGCVVRFASADLQSNRGLLVRAMAQTPYALWTGSPVTHEQLKEYVDHQLNLQKVFLEEFLRGIAISNPRLPPPRRSALPLLDRGVETSQAFKRLIAEFLGVPFGKELAFLRTAQANLQGPPRSSPPPPSHPPPDWDVNPPGDDDFFPEIAFGPAVHRIRMRRAGRPLLLWGGADAEDDVDWAQAPRAPPRDLFAMRAEAAQLPAAARAGVPANPEPDANDGAEGGIHRRVPRPLPVDRLQPPGPVAVEFGRPFVHLRHFQQPARQVPSNGIPQNGNVANRPVRMVHDESAAERPPRLHQEAETNEDLEESEEDEIFPPDDILDFFDT